MVTMRRAVLCTAALFAVVGLAYVWQGAGATGPALPLRRVGDYPLTGSASRFDYASMDAGRGVLSLAHMGDGSVEAFDVRVAAVRRTVPLTPNASVRGILAARRKVYAAAQGLGSVVVLDASSGRRLAIVPAGDAGNTQYDAGSKHVFVGVQNRDELVELDPAALKVVRRYALPGCSFSHSVAIDAGARAAYVGCQRNARLVRLDLRSGQVTGSGGVGIGVDVLALDPALHRLYVGSESGIVSVYDVAGGGLARMAQAFLALHAHVVAVDPATHRVYVPLEDVGGRPAMRVLEPK